MIASTLTERMIFTSFPINTLEKLTLNVTGRLENKAGNLHAIKKHFAQNVRAEQSAHPTH